MMKGNFVNDKVKARFEGDYPLVDRDEVTFMDIAPNQIVSVAASLIPFLEHDDANRALMGSNMQRQAVPLMNPEAPIVGTGLEGRVAEDSRALIQAEGEGEIVFVDATKIVVRYNLSLDETLTTFDDEVIDLFTYEIQEDQPGYLYQPEATLYVRARK